MIASCHECTAIATPTLFHSDFTIWRDAAGLVIKPWADRYAGNVISMVAARNASTCTVYTYIPSSRCKSIHGEQRTERRRRSNKACRQGSRNCAVIVIVSVAAATGNGTTITLEMQRSAMDFPFCSTSGMVHATHFWMTFNATMHHKSSSFAVDYVIGNFNI